MKDRYLKIVEWSEDDGCYIGSCPELFFGGCHGDDPKAVFAELCQIVEETIEDMVKCGDELPVPLSGQEMVRAWRKAS